MDDASKRALGQKLFDKWDHTKFRQRQLDGTMLGVTHATTLKACNAQQVVGMYQA